MLSTIYLILTRFFTRFIMHFTLILSIALNMYVCRLNSRERRNLTPLLSGICVYYWVTHYWCTHSLFLLSTCSVRDSRAFRTAGAIIFTIIALFSIFAYFGYRARIPLASLLLQVVMDVAKHHWSVYGVAFTALIIQAAWSV